MEEDQPESADEAWAWLQLNSDGKESAEQASKAHAQARAPGRPPAEPVSQAASGSIAASALPVAWGSKDAQASQVAPALRDAAAASASPVSQLESKASEAQTAPDASAARASRAVLDEPEREPVTQASATWAFSPHAQWARQRQPPQCERKLKPEHVHRGGGRGWHHSKGNGTSRQYSQSSTPDLKRRVRGCAYYFPGRLARNSFLVRTGEIPRPAVGGSDQPAGTGVRPLCAIRSLPVEDS